MIHSKKNRQAKSFLIPQKKSSLSDRVTLTTQLKVTLSALDNFSFSRNL